MRPIEASVVAAPNLLDMSTLVVALLGHIDHDSDVFATIQSVITSYHLLRQRGTLLAGQCSMAVKYSNLPRHEGGYYHDPVTGMLRHTDTFDKHDKVDKTREAKLLFEISEHKISQIDIDVA